MYFLQSNVRRPGGRNYIVAGSPSFRRPRLHATGVCTSPTMSSLTGSFLLLALLACTLLSHQPVSARILTQCDAAKELARAGVDRSFISNFVCVMKNDGDFNTSKLTGPGYKASWSYGIFQISSDKWCNAFRPDGICKKQCKDFTDDDIRDDIACAKIIFAREGFKHWKGWVKSCRNNLPNISGCIIRRDVTAEDLEASDEEELNEPEELTVK